ncbi:MAG: ABC transporter substrate-binding protein [Rhodospirillales bacterium]|nr:ABC transporter substrate-binding protein [Rhodospirillales bacterium]MBO6785457.1 ABC transporter substrate-binding protein [Rhodospirillales bacterium]
MKLARLTALAAAIVVSISQANAEPIRIGEINSYTRLPAFTEPYKKGWEMALEEINAKGGVDGRQLEVISRDDAGKPGNAVKIAEELVKRENVALLAGTFFSHIGLAVSDYAKQNKVLFVASEPLSDAIVWSKGNDYTFRLRPSTYMQAAMLAAEAAKTDAVKWATVAPNYAYGKDAVAAFKQVLTKLKPSVEFVDEQWPALFKIDAGVTVRALEAAKPEGIYNVTFGPDLGALVREGSVRGLFDGRTVVSLLTGEPEYLEPLKDEAPKGWIVTGYPWYAIDTPEHNAFKAAYEKRWGETLKMGSLVGYNTLLSIAALLEKSGSTDTDKMVAAMKGLEVSTPQGKIVYRAADHQATMGSWVGRTDVADGKGVMTGWKYVDGADVLPSAEEARAMRPAN